MENGFPWYKFVTSNAAYYGHLDCLKYAYKNGCPQNKRATSDAASKGQIDCLKYAHENGCPLNKETTLYNLGEVSFKIDLNDKWWRSFLFERDLNLKLHSRLKKLIDNKKEEIKKIKEETTFLCSYISKDITQYVLWTYF